MPMLQPRVGHTYVIGAVHDRDLCGMGRSVVRLTTVFPRGSLPPEFHSFECLVLKGLRAGQHVAVHGAKLRPYYAVRAVCRCGAYKFPHHFRKGKCDGPQS